MSDLTTKAAEIRAGLVADWRKAMEGVSPGAWTMEVESSDRVDEAGEDRQPEVYVCSSGTQCDFTVVATMGRAESIPHMRKSFDASWIARCSPAGIASLLALIEQQAAELAEARQAISAVTAATSAYLPPDGISKDECINRVLAATDNPKINAVMLGGPNGSP